MEKYKLKFKLLTYSLQTTVQAHNLNEAKNCVRNRVKFISVKPINDKYHVVADFYDKKISEIVEAKHEIQAKQFIVNSIIFVSEINLKTEQEDFTVETLKGFFGMK